ncbi:hypothetical protein [Sphingomonas sp. SAFR-052]|uniref:right-handed parallel beta-helix repeat-containing protein n=1 Tax=Sphingomonas sp. SAFR-052 TaxID=3436867 RepID=UPI003F7D1AC0
MAPFSDSVRDQYNRPVLGATIHVFTQAGALAALYTESGGSLDNPVLVDALGNYSFYADDAKYRREIRLGSLLLEASDIIVGSPPEFRGDPGAADNTYSSYADMQASDPTRLSARLVGDTDNPPHPDGPYSNPTQTIGGWVPQPASGIVFDDRTVDSKLRDVAITPDDFPLLANDTLRVQAALDARGLIQLNRAYEIMAPLTIRGGTQLVGKPGAKLVWSGTPADCILQDSSAAQKRAGQTPSDINLNILLENFEVVGGGFTSGGAYQVGIDFYRTGAVTIRGVTVHGIGGSGIRWGFSMADTIGVLVENCRVYDCRYGDAIQGVGRNIVVRNNTVGVEGSTSGNFGDTGIALLHDFSSVTNPNVAYSNDVSIEGNTIIGNYNDSGTYVGTGQQIQTGIAFGPFKIGARANIRVVGNVLSRCYLNLWGIVMDDVFVAQNTFGPHAATATGNVRMDGVTNLRIVDNAIGLAFAGTGPDYAGVLLVAQRNTFGASVFDADVSRYEVSRNTITASATVQGVRATFEQAASSPSYVSRLTDGKVEDNTFNGVTTPIALAPQTGATVNVCSSLVMRGNRPDTSASSLVMVGGNGPQYNAVRLLDNPAPANVPPWSGTGAGRLIVQHKAFSSVSATSGTATPVLVLPSRSVRVDVHAYVDNGNADFSATATIAVNNGVASFKQQADGAKLMLTLDGLTVRATQTAGGTAPIDITATYS